MTNPLLNDRDVAFLLYEVLDAEALCANSYFSEHSRDTFEMFLDNARRLSREHLYPAYRPMDVDPPRMVDGSILLHPKASGLYRKLVDLGMLNASRPESVGGAQLPNTVGVLASMYLMAANLHVFGFAMLTTGAAHLIESFGDDSSKREFMDRMYDGEWTGTMALTEPHAGSSLGDITTKATPTDDGHYLISGAKIFISGGDHDLTDNVVNMTLARIEGAPGGSRGISLFAVPKRRLEDGQLVDNDLHTSQMIHKIGWRGLPSLALSYGENGDCRGWLIGEPHKGLRYMFQMMNSARIFVGAHGVATAAVAYHESVAYARERTQGRPLASKGRGGDQVPIVEHADVRRMLLRQKAIVEGGMCLIGTTARYLDLAEASDRADERERAESIVGLLTPVAKSFPAEAGFESNALAVQIHGGYGYTSEYLPESWLRDQKLNSIHEGTTGIQGLDLLGRKVVGAGGEHLRALVADVQASIARAREAEVDPAWCDQLAAASDTVVEVTMTLAAKGMGGDADGMMAHSASYLDMFSTWVVAWQWLEQAAAATRGLVGRPDDGFYGGKLCTAQYWFATEVPRISTLAALCSSADDSYLRMQPDWF
jgi:butyryl-CoA dehydrogenase